MERNDFDAYLEETPLKKKADQLTEKIYGMIKSHVERMTFFGFDESEIQVEGKQERGGLSIWIGPKRSAVTKTPKVQKDIVVGFGEEKARMIIEHIIVNRDVSVHVMMAAARMTDDECQSLYRILSSNGMLKIFQNIYHSCSEAPVACVELVPGVERPSFDTCPECDGEFSDSLRGMNMYLATKECQEMLTNVPVL